MYLKQDNYISIKEIKKYNYKYEYVKKHNQDFIERKLVELKDYFDNIYKGIDDNIILDKEQRIAILTDEDYNMIIAGAGSGKTTTMAAKVKYLVEIKKIDPKDIVLISYTNKAVEELKERINIQFKIPVLVCTFHKFGIDILKQTTNKDIKVLLNGYDIISDYFSKNLSNDNKLLKEFLDFFIYYFNVPDYALKFKSLNEYHNYKRKSNYITLKSKINYNNKVITERKNKQYTILNEYLNSIEEVMIANFLYLNGIEYSYKKPYFKLINNKEYIPDFTIYQNNKIFYLEHFNQIRFDLLKIKYMKHKLKISDIRNIHIKNKTQLIEIYSNENLLDNLKRQLIDNGFVLKPKSDREIYDILFNNSNDIYYTKFIIFCLNFIQSFKINGCSKKDFLILKQTYTDKRSKLFLNFIEKVYDYYEKQLRLNNYIDFEDMINSAKEEMNNYKLNYKYIIIDEYQDISLQRFNLAKKISEISDSKITVVGDDWQSIFTFAGSDISLFTQFKKMMGYSEELKITNTYRNSQELIDIAGKFIMQNKFQIKKQLKSPKKNNNPVIILTYDDTNNKVMNRLKVLDNCVLEISKENDRAKILLIGRYNFERKYLFKDENYYESNNKLFNKKYPNLDFTFLSAHSSKGLGFDYVIILNVEDSLYGFPSQIKDDPIMDMVIKKDNSYLDAEERRLFYVALTRTKNKTYILTPVTNCSSFVLEIINYKNVKLNNATNIKLCQKNKCPICKYPLVRKYNKINNLYVCSNEKELCDFKTNNLMFKKNIVKCPKCKIGDIIVKSSNNKYFLGCTKYKEGCNYTEKIYK